MDFNTYIYKYVHTYIHQVCLPTYIHITYITTQPTKKNQKDSVPYALLIRCKRIFTKDYHFEQEGKKIYNQLKYRKYPTTLLDEAIEK